ncbi:type III-A CRISPR-associated RAMP protein Csm3 [Crenalkalicoccus roseus]|uniref:type III-A CRISPR-associated RAMP protein Csm3 n=1 Tax=Crenalkalicoccus roseus TaxID=1485588 RepID=UPI0010804C85|nr:type III-A CRISPR-associated RAMP protein Csm3 [Crenalkalicoccus roseus]
MSSIREAGRVRVTGLIRLRSGLHIGAGKDSVEIGGIDNPVIKHPHTGEPYIPGSSLKGKLRFLLEWAFGKVRADGHAWGFNDNQPVEADDPVLRIFGNALKEWKSGPTRLMVRDAPLCGDDWDRYREAPEAFFEEKTEVLIDRISGKAHGEVGPRQTERVPAGVAFKFEMAFRLYDLGDGAARDLDCLNWALQGLALLEEDALGGSGSRGYGRIAFEDLALYAPGPKEIRLDNRFRGHRFDRAKAPAIVRAEEVLGVPA